KLFAVYEYIEGITLKDYLLLHNSMNSVLSSELMGQILDALSYAHSKGIVHRDIKPTNIMLIDTGARIHAKVLDFGIGVLSSEAKYDGYTSLTLTQETLGTPSYSSPEQLRGESVNAKSDLYVWALVFIECLTGQPAVTGSSLASIFHKQLAANNIPLPPALVGHPLGDLLRKLLVKNVRERFGNTLQIYDELKSINVSSLVGDIQPAATNSNASNNCITGVLPDDDKTQNIAFSYTHLTERRHICALSLSIDILSDNATDPEILHTLLEDQINQCMDLASRYGGYSVGTLGNLCMFYFGYPLSSDNDSRLCSRAALELMSNIQNKNRLLYPKRGIKFLLSVGISSGLFSISDNAIPTGDIANLSLKLSNLANEGEILCTESFSELISRHVFTEQTTHRYQNISDSILSRYCKITGERKNEAFGTTKSLMGTEDFVGRGREISRIIGSLNTRQNENFFLQGEAGVGKSRLIEEIRKKTKNRTQLSFQFLPENKHNALYPFIEFISKNLEKKYSNNADKIEYLNNIIKKIEPKTFESILIMCCSWLNIPVSQEMQDCEPLPTEKQKNVLFTTLKTILKALSKTENESSVYICEDLHWADPTSLEFINHLASESNISETVLLGSSRTHLDTFNENFQNHFVEVVVERFDNTTIREFIRSKFQGLSVSETIYQTLTLRSEGTPLFLDELILMIKNQQLVSITNQFVDFNSNFEKSKLPSSLTESLQEKLGNLSVSLEAAQVASAIGRDFSYELLVQSMNASEESTQMQLQELIEKEVIYRQRVVGNEQYIFKHALIRDAAYQSTPKPRLTEIHHDISVAMQTHPNYKNNTQRIATHYSLSERYEEAAEFSNTYFLSQTGTFANVELVEFGHQVLTWIDKIEDPLTQLFYNISVSTLLFPAELSINGYGSIELDKWLKNIEDIDESLVLKLSAGDQEKFDSLNDKREWNKFFMYHNNNIRDKARSYGEYLLDKSVKNNNQIIQQLVLSILSQAYLFDGELKQSIEGHEKALELYNQKDQKISSMEYGFDVKPMNLAMMSLPYLHSGDITSAVKRSDASVNYCETSSEVTSPISIALSYLFVALSNSLSGQESETAKKCLPYYEKHHDEKNPIFYERYISVLYHSAIDELDTAQKSLNKFWDNGITFATGWYVPNLAKKYISKNKTTQALELAKKSVKFVKEANELACLPISLNCLALCLYKFNGEFSDEVASILKESLSLSQHQNADLFEYEAIKYLEFMDKSTITSMNLSKRLEELTHKFRNHPSLSKSIKTYF
ncbi:protein kinase domain-containing protein, partial [Sessilibacter corallicola]|uniref:protein kinase domain-containing protein n=1 Tax=Sessilibacter corallicola TaxID=2904075 RepID=UPI0033419EB8